MDTQDEKIETYYEEIRERLAKQERSEGAVGAFGQTGLGFWPIDQKRAAQRNPTWTVLHNRIHLAVHELRGGIGRPLLLLHGLGEQSPTTVPPLLSAWPGPVYAMDFTGHGKSTVPKGGGYTSELLLVDVDMVITELIRRQKQVIPEDVAESDTGCSPYTPTIYGRGLGAYIALLVAGTRGTNICGGILDDGPGLMGGGVRPSSLVALPPRKNISFEAPDFMAQVELSRDIRPMDYAQVFARQAKQWSKIENPLAVCSFSRPEWLSAIVEMPGVKEQSLGEALAYFSSC